MKATRITTVALCILLLVLPSLAMPIFPSGDDSAENRYLADYPTLADEDGLNPDFDDDFEAWLRDHFALRQQAVRANAQLNYSLLRTSPNSQVIVGDGDWLYFDETVADYTGEGRFTDEELALLSGNLSALADALAERGARLYIAIVPNKNTVYPQYMPGRYAMRADEGNLPLLREACADIDAQWIDLVGPLEAAAAGDRLVYLKTDTHWNALGAAIAADAVLEAMGRANAPWRDAGDTDFHDGDLARLMGLSGVLSESVPDIVPDVPLPEADFGESRVSVEGDGEGTLAVYRDSFGTAIGPWLAGAFERTELRWEYPLDGTIPCDAALVLLCERNLRTYLTEPPIVEGEAEAIDAGAEDAAEEFTDVDEDFFDDADEDDDEFSPIDDGDDIFADDGDEDDDFEDYGDDDGFFDDAEDDEEAGWDEDGI